MSGEMMEADDSLVETNLEPSDMVMEVNTEESLSVSENKTLCDGNSSLKSDKENKEDQNNSTADEATKENVAGTKTLPAKNGEAVNGEKSTKEKNVWSIRSPFPLKHHCSHTFVSRRKSYDNYPSKQESTHVAAAEKHPTNAVKTSFNFDNPVSPSAFVRKAENRPQPFPDEDLDGNILKRCNSAPILNETDDSRIDWNRPIASTSGRIRRFSANVVSVNSSPASAARSRLRLHQLQKEESLEGIQNKETAHEREVQTTIQISSNCGDLSLNDRRTSLDGGLPSPRNNSLSPSAFPPAKHFPAPPSALTGGKSSRAIDFSTSALSPTHPHHPIPHLPPSGGIPSPLTFSPSPSLLNLSPLPPSPTRGICGPGKQCFSPSMQVPVSLARAASRSPSPSPTRRTFVTRRRSQSPCIMRPSALGPIKRKYDSDSEGSCSPKRIFLSNPSHVAVPGGSGDAPMSLPNSTPVRSLVQRSHSLSSSSVDSSDLYVSPSPPHQGNTFVTHHHGNHIVTGFLHPLHHSSSPMHSQGATGSQVTEKTRRHQLWKFLCSQLDHPQRSLSPASSTCSSSSLEGLRDLQPLTSAHQVITQKKS